MSSSAIRPGERPLLAFVSSVMDDDLRLYRKTVVECLRKSTFLAPWVFEFTPASSEPLDESYLRHVRDADVVIWIGGDETSTPVVREINEAITYKKRLWIFLLPLKKCRDDGTKTIIETVGVNQGPKWFELKNHSIETFEVVFELTLRDELARAFRNDTRWRRSSKLEQLTRESRARCLSRFIACGLKRDLADFMLTKISDLPVLATPNFPKEGEVSLLVGTLGSGKSFVAEKVYQEILDQSRSPMDPVPFYINAGHIRNSLETHIIQLNSELGDVTSIGALIIVDQVDDLSFSDSRRLYEEALTLAIAWPKTRILLVSRPQSWIPDGVDITYVREMSLEEAETVIKLVSDSDRSQLLWILPDAVRRSVQRPLFAILLARYLESQAERVPVSKAKLLDRMVRKAVENAGTESNESIEKTLRSLAVKQTDGHVNVTLLNLSTSISHGNALLKTHLVYEESGQLDFALPILRQWFAFDALRQNEVDIEELSKDQERLKQWEDVLTTAVELATDQIDDIIEPIVVNNPSVVSVILDSAFGHLWYGNADSVLPADTFGKHIRRAMTAFAKGIGPLSGLIAPVNEQGEVKPLGVAKLKEGYYKTSWYEGFSDLEEVVDISTDGSSTTRDWRRSLSRTRIDSPAWAWLDVKEQLKRSLENLLKCYGIPIQNSYFLHEAAWYLISSVMDRYSLLGLQFPTDELKDVRRWINKVPSSSLRGYSPETLASAIMFLQEQIDEITSLRSPWPGPDQSLANSKLVWDPYTPERLRKRIECVLGASLQIYHEIVSTWFTTMANRFELYSFMPVRLVGYLYVPEGKTSEVKDDPSFTYYFEPLQKHESSRADVYLDSISNSDLKSIVLEANPSATTLYTSMVVDVFFGGRPATDMAYTWLNDGLKSVRWI